MTDPAEVVPDELMYRGQIFEFTPGFAAALRRTTADLTPVPDKARVWTELQSEGRGRHKLAVARLREVVRSPARDLVLLAGTPETNKGLLETVHGALGTAPLVEYVGEAKALIKADEPRRRMDLNLVRIRVTSTLLGQWPPSEALQQLTDTLAELNARGVFTKAVVEVTEETQVPAQLRERVVVVATEMNCERLIRWR